MQCSPSPFPLQFVGFDVLRKLEGVSVCSLCHLCWMLFQSNWFFNTVDLMWCINCSSGRLNYCVITVENCWVCGVFHEKCYNFAMLNFVEFCLLILLNLLNICWCKSIIIEMKISKCATKHFGDCPTQIHSSRELTQAHMKPDESIIILTTDTQCF